MKKFLSFVFVICLSVLFFGCGNDAVEKIEQNMSETTKVYYLGECEEFYCTLSSGTREKDYLLNGFSTDKVPFSLLTLKFFNQNNLNMIRIILNIENTQKEVDMELNPISGQFMVDLEKEIGNNKNISVIYNSKTCHLENLSKDFKIGYKKAIAIGASLFEKQILKNQSFGTLGCEGYLKVVDKKSGDYDEVFWAFSILDMDGKNWSAIISTEDGKILSYTKQ